MKQNNQKEKSLALKIQKIFINQAQATTIKKNQPWFFPQFDFCLDKNGNERQFATLVEVIRIDQTNKPTKYLIQI